MDTHSIQLLGEFQRTAAEQTLGVNKPKKKLIFIT